MSRADDSFERDEWLASRSQNFNKIMIVEFNSGSANFVPVQQGSTRRADTAVTKDDLSVSYSNQSLQVSLKQASQSRPAMVAQANALANDGSYPSDNDLTRLAGFLASRI